MPAQRALIPVPFTLAEYRPASGPTVSSLRIAINAVGAESSRAVITRQLVLKDAAADAAWAWITANTPAELQF